MAISVTAGMLISAVRLLTSQFSLEAGGPNPGSGYLNYIGKPLQLSNDSSFLENGVLLGLCKSLGSTDYPLFKLTTRQLSPDTEVYHVDKCSTCYDVYLECNEFPFRIEETGDVRINFEGVWSAVCVDDSFTAFDINGETFCEKFDLPNWNVSVIPGSFGSESKSWKLRETCLDPPQSLYSCKFMRYLIKSDCREESLLAFNCEPITPVLRIDDMGKGGRSGMVQIRYKGNIWYPIAPCVHFSLNDAVVLCRTLGYPSSDSSFNLNYRPFLGFAADFKCNGTEDSLKDCKGLNKFHTCFSDGIIEISCDNAYEGKLRLTGGYARISGRLEIYHNNTWGTVCGKSFGQQEIDVACYQITNGTASEAQRIGREGGLWDNRVDVLLDGVKCQSGKTRLDACDHKPWGEHSCESNDTLIISCSEEPQYRLTDASGTYGRLEVYHDGQWGAICYDNYWGDNEARTACKTLHLPSRLPLYFAGAWVSDNDRVWLSKVKCARDTDHLNNCQRSRWGEIQRSDSCRSLRLSCGDPDMRSATTFLAGFDKVGIVYVSNIRGHGAVCMESRSEHIAVVACRGLGLPTENAKLLPENMIEYNGHDYVFNGVSCQGYEASLFDCSYTSLLPEHCNLSNRLTVACGEFSGSDYSLRLVNSDSSDKNAGSLEVLLFGIWGTVCSSGFGASSAQVACRQLGLPTNEAQVLSRYTNASGSGVTWLNNVVCGGQEPRLETCPKNINFRKCPGSSHDVAIRCAETTRTGNFDAIVGGVISAGIFLVALLVVICLVRHRSKSPVPAHPSQPMGTSISMVGQRPPQPAQITTSGSANPVYNDDHGFMVSTSPPPRLYSPPPHQTKNQHSAG